MFTTPEDFLKLSELKEEDMPIQFLKKQQD